MSVKNRYLILSYRRVKAPEFKYKSRSQDRGPSPPCPHKWESHEEIEKLEESLKKKTFAASQDLKSVRSSKLQDKLASVSASEAASSSSSVTTETRSSSVETRWRQEQKFTTVTSKSVSGQKSGGQVRVPEQKSDDAVRFYESTSQVRLKQNLSPANGSAPSGEIKASAGSGLSPSLASATPLMTSPSVASNASESSQSTVIRKVDSSVSTADANVDVDVSRTSSIERVVKSESK